MRSIGFKDARRVVMATVAGATIGALCVEAGIAQSTITVAGVAANQPAAPVKLQSCAAVVNGTAFLPQLVFDAPTHLRSATVTYSFFDKANVALGETDVTPPYTPKTYPLQTATFTCAIVHEDLADGGVFPAAVAHNNTGLVVAGVIGVGVIAALAGHGGSSSTPSQTAAPSTFAPVTPMPTPSSTLAPGTTPSPTASPTLAPGATPSPTPSPTLAPGATPSPTPSPTGVATVMPSPTPTPSPVGALVVNPNMLSFTSTGATSNATISESGGYSGTFTLASNTCTSGGSADNGAIATLSPSQPYANPSTVMVTSGEAGTCTITFRDASGNIAQIVVQVTLSNVVVNGRHRAPAKSAPPVKSQTVPGSRSGSGSSIAPIGTSASHKT